MTARPLVVLDIDDTLYLERDYVRSGFDAAGEFVCSRWGATGFSDAAWRLFESGHRGNTFDTVMGALGLQVDDSVIALLVDAYRTHQPSINLLPDAGLFLDRLAHHVDFGIVTDGPAASQRAKIKALGLSKWVHPDAIVVTDEHGQSWRKPSTRAFLALQDSLKTSPCDCYYVADNPTKDFIGPMELGWNCIWVKRDLRIHNADFDPGPVAATVNSLGVECEDRLRELLTQERPTGHPDQREARQ